MAIKLNTRKQKEARDTLVNRFMAAAQTRRPYEDVWRRVYKQYRGINTISRDTPVANREDKSDRRSMLHIPRAFEIVENVIPSFVLSISSKRPMFVYSFRRQTEDKKLLADMMTKIVDEQFYEQDGQLTLLRAIKEAVIFGNMILKIVPDKTNTTNFRPLMRAVSNTDIFLDWFDIEQPRFIMHRVHRTPSDLTKSARSGFYDAQAVENAIKKSSKKNTPMGEELTKEDLYAEVDRAVFDDTIELIEVIEYWGKYDLDGDGVEEEIVATIAEREFLLRIEKNPFVPPDGKEALRPFVIVPFIPTKEPYGVGLIEPALDLLDEMNTKRNQRIDNVNKVIDPPLLANKFAGLDYETLEYRQGNIVWWTPTGGQTAKDALNYLPMPDVTGSIREEVSMIDRDIQATTGVFPQFAGQPAQRRETATTTVALQQAASKRFQSIMEMFTMNALLKIARHFFVYNQIYMPKQNFVIPVNNPLTGQKEDVPVSVSAKDFREDFDTTVLVSVSAGIDNQQMRIANLLRFLQVVGSLNPQLLAQQGYQLELPDLVKEIQKSLGLSDVNVLKRIANPNLTLGLQPQGGGGLPQQGTPTGIPETNMPRSANMADELRRQAAVNLGLGGENA